MAVPVPISESRAVGGGLFLLGAVLLLLLLLMPTSLYFIASIVNHGSIWRRVTSNQINHHHS